MQTVQVEYSGQIQVNAGKNPRELYAHQNEAIKALDQKNKLPFEGLLVLPTGGGKTLAAVHWLLRNYVDKRKKVLWIAHRHELLDQVVSQKLVGGKVDRSNLAFSSSDVYSCSV